MEGIAMKRFAALALILCIGLFTIGCAETKKKKDKPADEPVAEADAKDAAPAADIKTDAKKDEEN